MFVVLHHCSLLWFTEDLHHGWNSDITDNNKWFMQLPGIRLVVSGHPQVSLFFVVSGYALSYKALKLARQGRLDEVGSVLASSLFRRHSRLFMPAAAVTFFTAIATWLGCFQPFELVPVAVPNREPPRFESLWLQLLHFGWNQVSYTNPLTTVDYNVYDLNLWTLPIEFKGSIVVFLCLMAFTRLPSRVRILFTVALAWYVEWVFMDWILFTFLGGMIICDVHFEVESFFMPSRKTTSEKSKIPMPAMPSHKTLPTINTVEGSIKQDFLQKGIAMLSFFGAIYVLSIPEVEQGREMADGYVTSAKFIPKRFGNLLAVPVAAVWLTFTIDHAKFLQDIFTNNFAQYLGRISFMLYLVHGPLLWTWGSFLSNLIIPITGQDTDGQYLLGVALSAALWWPVTILLADCGERYVDKNCVAFIRWFYNKLERDVRAEKQRTAG